MSVPTSGLPAAARSSRVVRRRNRKVVEIVATATDVLSERGYHDTSLDEIAERLDIGKATLYHYFPNKEALVMACMEAVGTQTNEKLRVIAAEAGTARERLAALIRSQLDIVVARPQMATLFRQPRDLPEAFRERARELRREHYSIFRDVVRDGIESGEFAVDDEDVALHNLYGAMNYVPVWFRPKRKKDVAEMATSVVDNLLRLFLPAAP